MAYLMVLPAVVFFLLFPAAATYLVGHLSLFKTDYVMTKFIGLGNYGNMLYDMKFWRSMVNGITYCALIIPMMLTLVLLVAFLASDFSLKVQNAVKFTLYIPVLAAGVIISNVWRWIYADGGMANWLLGLFGIGAVPWLSDPLLAKVAIAVMFVFTLIGANLIIVLSSIVAVPRHLIEAARIDGASGLQVKLRIILPIIMPTVFLVVMLMMISAMQMWEFVYRLTNGGPSGWTATPVFDLYETAFTYGKYGMASAKALVIMAVILAMVVIQKRIEKAGK